MGQRNEHIRSSVPIPDPVWIVHSAQHLLEMSGRPAYLVGGVHSARVCDTEVECVGLRRRREFTVRRGAAKRRIECLPQALFPAQRKDARIAR